MKEPNWVPESAVESIHTALIVEHGRIPGLRDPGLLSASLDVMNVNGSGLIRLTDNSQLKQVRVITSSYLTIRWACLTSGDKE